MKNSLPPNNPQTNASPIRYVFLLALLILVGAATLFIAYARPTPTPPAPAAPIAVTTAVPLHSYLVDVAGWYEITPNERVVATPIDFSIDSLKVLPETLGRWHSTPYQLGSEVDQWFENPDLAISTSGLKTPTSRSRRFITTTVSINSGFRFLAVVAARAISSSSTHPSRRTRRRAGRSSSTALRRLPSATRRSMCKRRRSPKTMSGASRSTGISGQISIAIRSKVC